MSLTVSDRTHWRDRIARRIDQRIESMVAKGDPLLLQHVAEQARRRAYESLGIGAQQEEMAKLQEQKAEIEKRERRLQAEQRSAINGTPIDAELQRGSYYGRSDPEIETAVTSRAKALEADILAESELGRQVLSLRAEKENLLDTVWLATSSSQIKELWTQVNALLEAAPTVLEEKALLIPPVEAE
jgi:hypothetical protein